MMTTTNPPPPPKKGPAQIIDEFRAALYSESRDAPHQFARVFDIVPYINVDDDASGCAASAGGANPKQPQSNSSSVTQSINIDDIEWKQIAALLINVYEALSPASDDDNNSNNNNAGISTAYESQSKLHATFNNVFATTKGNWYVPALHQICRSTHRLAVAADKVAANPSEHVKLLNAATLLQESFSRTFNDRKELLLPDDLSRIEYDSDRGSKKIGVLYIVNTLFAIYFQLNTLRLCKNLVRPLESRHLQDKYPSMSQMVTYRYYVGRLHLFEDQYELSEQNLEIAFRNCHKDAVHNKRLILRYLIPVKLYRGKLPTAALLTKYNLDHEFLPLVEGIRTGDLRTYNHALTEYQDRFICQGTYLLLEKCKTVCYRNLLKRIHFIFSETNQVKLQMIATAFKYLQLTSIDYDEIECILANLIYRGYVRGYLSHAKRVLVLSKRDPFPLTSVIGR